MRLIITLFLCLLLAGTLETVAQPNREMISPAGVWVGRLGSDSGHLYFRFSERPPPPSSTSSSSPDLALDVIGFQPGFALPADHLEISGDRISFGIRARSIAFQGNVATNALSGEWNEAGATTALKLRPIPTPTWISTRQDPVSPFPYHAEEIRVSNPRANLTLAGTLTRPFGNGSFPAVLLLTGQNPQDRDSSDQHHRPFRVWADYLTRRGFAVLRCDDRGVGGSEGTFASATIADFATDAQAGVTYLCNRPDIDSSRIGILGHSEGGMVAPMVASSSQGVAFLLLLAPPVFPMPELWSQQFEPICRRLGADARQGEIIRRFESKIFQGLRENPDTASARADLRQVYSSLLPGITDQDRKILDLPSRENEQREVETAIDEWLSPWMRFAFRYDPGPALRGVSCPVLALFAGKDESVLPEPNRARAEELLEAGRCATFSVRLFPDLDHGFRHPVTFNASTAFPLAETVATDVLSVVGKWLDVTVLHR